MRGANWAKDYSKNNKSVSLKALKKVKCDRRGKKFQLIKVCNSPPTWKEVEIIGK